MVSMSDVQRIRDWALANNFRVVFSFEKYPYVLVIDRVIHARDNNDVIVDWSKAFGSKLPHQVLSSLKLRRIVILRKNVEIMFFNSLTKFMSHVREQK